MVTIHTVCNHGETHFVGLSSWNAAMGDGSEFAAWTAKHFLVSRK